MCNFCRRLISLRNYLLRLMSAQLMSLTAFKTRDVFAQLFVTLDVCAIDVFDNINIYRHYCKESTESLQKHARWQWITCFCDERGYSHKEELRFQWRKTDLIETEKHGRLLKVLSNCAFHVVLESYAVQAWGLLWCFNSDGLSEQLITPIRAFQFDNSSFLHASFSTRALGAVLYNILAQKMVEYRPASDRSFLRIERAYFTQFSLCFDNSDDVFGIMVFDELVKKNWAESTRAWLNHSFNQKGGVRGCLICVSFVLQEPSWSIQQIDVLPLRSPWL